MIRAYFDSSAIFKLAKESFHVGAADGDATDPVMHSTRFVLVDRAGKIRGYYDSNEPAQLAALSRDAATLHGSAAPAAAASGAR